MPTAVWSSSPADGDWTNASNWTGGSGAGGIPANGDTFLINASSQDIDTNLTTGLTSITGKIGPGYTGTIGGSANFLDFDGTLDFDSRGSATYITGILTTVTVHGGVASDNMLQFQAAASTDIGTLRCLGGEGIVTVGQNAVLDNVEMIQCPGLVVIVDENVTSIDDLTIDSGRLDVRENVAGTIEARGGEVIVKEAATVATITVERNGRVDYRSSGTITTLTNYGIFDGRRNANAAVTVTNATSYEPAKWFLRNGLNTWLNFTNGIVYHGSSVLELPAGSTITLS